MRQYYETFRLGKEMGRKGRVKAGIMEGIFWLFWGVPGAVRDGKTRRKHPASYLHISLPQDLES
ncbi:MAG: hypothetical protein ACLR0U_00295 [Enterocloster clostridioformis]